MNSTIRVVIKVFILTVIFGTIYTTVQQAVRLSANETQTQLSEALAQAMNAGSDPKSLLGGRVDVKNTISPFAIIYDTTGKVIAGNGVIDNQIPSLPNGVLAYTKDHTQDRITWQPTTGVRIAAVVTKANNGYVLAGKSLRDTENIESKILEIALIGYLISLVAYLFSWFLRVKGI